MATTESFARVSSGQSLPNANYSGSVSSLRDADLRPASPRYGASMQFPSAEILLMNYKSNVTGQVNITPPSSTTHPRSSDLLNTMDPIAMHLLVETALGDAKEFEVMSFEELEELKREDVLLNSRIEAVRRKLALETKVRDAAKSLNRLYASPSASPKLGRRSISSSSDVKSKRATMDKAEMELATSIKKCDELSRELYHLEQRSRASQMRFLKHTAGVLQMTYRQPKRRRYDVTYLSSGRPDSPASLDGFDRALDDYDGDNLSRSPDRLDGYLDEMRAERPRPRLSFRASRDAAAQRKVLIDIGSKLERLNQNVRDVITSTTSSKAAQYADMQLPEFAPAGVNIDGSISQQLDYLSKGLEDIRAEQGYLQEQLRSSLEAQSRTSQLESDLQAAVQKQITIQNTTNDMTNRLRDINAEFADIIEANRPDELPPIPAEEEGMNKQLEYTEERVEDLKSIIESSVQAANAARSTVAASGDKAAQYEVVLQGLWEIILAGEEDTKQRKRAERNQLEAKRAAGADVDSDDELSPDEDDGLSDEFSLPAFSTKVQWLVSKSTYLKEKQGNLRRRIQQHREALNRAVSPSEDPSVQQLRADHERTTEQYAAVKEELADLENQLARREDEIKALRNDLANRVQEARDNADDATRELQGRLEEAQARVQALQTELDAAILERKEAEATLSTKDAALQKSQGELQELEGEVVRLTTELTIAKADLDAAYGSRSQRAADWAAAANTEATAKLEEVSKRNAQLEAEIAALAAEKESAGGSFGAAQGREDELRAELQSTLAEFEELTRASVEAEKERESLEAEIDKMRDQIEGLEAQLSDERVKWMGVKSPGGPGGIDSPPQSMGTAVLRNEFKKMMRDTRADHLRALRAEQDERRKVEAQLRAMRREQGPTKSALSKSMTS